METVEVAGPSLVGWVGLVAEPEAPMEVRQLGQCVCEVVRAERRGLAGESKLELDVAGRECCSITEHRDSLSPDDPTDELGCHISSLPVVMRVTGPDRGRSRCC
jgi:hypothetical protein